MITVAPLRRVENLPPRVPVYVCGTGAAGRALAAAIKARPELNFAGYVDRLRSGTLDGWPIRTVPEFVDEQPPDYVLVIASQYWEDIAETLVEHGLRRFLNGYALSMRLLEEKEAGRGPGGRPQLTVARSQQLVLLLAGAAVIATAALLTATLR